MLLLNATETDENHILHKCNLIDLPEKKSAHADDEFIITNMYNWVAGATVLIQIVFFFCGKS